MTVTVSGVAPFDPFPDDCFSSSSSGDQGSCCDSLNGTFNLDFVECTQTETTDYCEASYEFEKTGVPWCGETATMTFYLTVRDYHQPSSSSSVSVSRRWKAKLEVFGDNIDDCTCNSEGTIDSGDFRWGDLPAVISLENGSDTGVCSYVCSFADATAEVRATCLPSSSSMS